MGTCGRCGHSHGTAEGHLACEVVNNPVFRAAAVTCFVGITGVIGIPAAVAIGTISIGAGLVYMKSYIIKDTIATFFNYDPNDTDSSSETTPEDQQDQTELSGENISDPND